MRRLAALIPLLVLVLLGGPVQPCAALTFFDNFDDGDAGGWFIPAEQGGGNWRVEDGTLVQDLGGERYKFLVESPPVSTQSVEALVSTNDPPGYGGVTIWYQDAGTWVDIFVYRQSDVASSLSIVESFDGTGQGFVFDFFHAHDGFSWYDLRVDADSATGELALYVDGARLFTYRAATTYRTGLSGLNSGNTGGRFDDFRLTGLTGAEPVIVSIDVRPGSSLNRINARSNGMVPVAILSTEDLNALSEVDQSSLTFGPTGDEASAAFCNARGVDVNGDGLKDLVCHFRTQNAAFQCEDGVGILRGRTVTGEFLEGSQAVSIEPCK